ncbi:RNA-directed DNA polymerase, eukaryota, reverse transcriptase zinc-binding domain protein [Tanacetum coccineum]
MSEYELNYNLRRMWSKYGLIDVKAHSNGNRFFKFRNENGMNEVLKQGPWIVNHRPLFVQRWDPAIGMEEKEKTKILVWAKLTNSGFGRLEYAKVLVEFDLKKGFKDKIEVRYRNKENEVKGSKTVKVEYSWKPEICSHCLVFGHGDKIVLKGQEHQKSLDRLKEDNKDAENLEDVIKNEEQADYNWKTLWKELKAAKTTINDSPWFLAGDFNVTLKVNEHSTGGSKVTNDMQYLVDCVNDIEIKDICSSGLFYTWIKSPKKTSSTVLTIPKSIPKKFKAFRFANYVVDKHEFKNIVKKGWEVEIEGCNMFRVVKKLKALKSPLNKLNWRKGNLFDIVTKLKKELKQAQIQMEKNPHNSELKKIDTKCLENYIEAVNDAKKLLFQSAKIEWLKNRTKFEGDMVAEQFVKHFYKFLGTVDNTTLITDAASLFKNKLKDKEAIDMICEVTDSEIKKAVFDIDDAKAPGLDGFTSAFFKKSWMIIGKDVCSAIKDFFTNGKLLGESAFVPGRLIQDNLLLTQELLKGYNCKNGPKRRALKVDIAKAYDTLSWEFLESILLHFGFHRKMIQWIMTCVSTPRKVASNPAFKYHKGCKELKLTHLSFVDDLLVMSHGDHVSVSLIKDALSEFSESFGLKPNMIKYLGIPLLSKKIGILMYGYIKNHKKTIKNGQTRTRERRAQEKPKIQSQSQKKSSFSQRKSTLSQLQSTMGPQSQLTRRQIPNVSF